MVKVAFEPLGRVGEAEPGQSILDVANRIGVGMRSECGGTHTCGKCRIIMRDQVSVSPMEAHERKRLTDGEIAAGYRLACAVKVVHNARKIAVMIPPESILRSRRFSGEDFEVRVRLEPLVLEHLNDIETRGSSIFAGKRHLLGLAVDVGTSRVTVRLCDLRDGSVMTTRSIENPQIAFGENLITRAAYAQKSEESKRRLREELINGINSIVAKLVCEGGVEDGDIMEAVVVGNTVMHHLLLGLDTGGLTRAPFTPATKKMIKVNGDESGLAVNPRALVVFLPNIDAFVGADAVADILSSNLKERAEPTLLLDVGTNTELMLRAGGDTLACSCASGPAFEGEHIEHGMKAVEGAVEGVRIRGQTVTYATIGGGRPIGLCGSGIVDAVAELLRVDLISGVGRFKNSQDPRIVSVGNQRKYIIVPAADSGTGSDITISERDVNEIILAKAAIGAAAEVLMGMKGVNAKDLKRVIVAGAFGEHLNKTNAKTIGLIPNVENRRILHLGNAALAGATMALKSKTAIEKAVKIAEETHYVELASNPSFDAAFRRALLLRHPRAKRY